MIYEGFRLCLCIRKSGEKLTYIGWSKAGPGRLIQQLSHRHTLIYKDTDITFRLGQAKRLGQGRHGLLTLFQGGIRDGLQNENLDQAAATPGRCGGSVQAQE